MKANTVHLGISFRPPRKRQINRYRLKFTYTKLSTGIHSSFASMQALNEINMVIFIEPLFSFRTVRVISINIDVKPGYSEGVLLSYIWISIRCHTTYTNF